MSCGLGSPSGNVRKVVDAQRRTLSTRSLDQNNYKFCPKECQLSTLISRDSQQRCIYFTLFTLGLDTPLRFLPPCRVPVQESDSRNNFGSGAHSDLDDPQSVSPPPAIIFCFDLQKEQRTNLPENSTAAKSFSTESLGLNALAHSRKRNKRTKSTKSSSTSSARSVASENSSASVCDGLNVVHSDILIPDILKVENPVKRSPRKKGKRKGKQHKRSLRKKVSGGRGTQGEEGISGASVYDTPISGHPACSGDSVSKINLSEKATSSSLSVKDIVMEKDDSKVSSNGSIACTSYINEMDVSEPIASSSVGFAVEEYSCNQSRMDEVSTNSSNTSCVVQSQEITLSTSGHPKQDSTSCDVSCNNFLDQSTDPQLDSPWDGWNSDLSVICSDDLKKQLPIKDESRFSSSESVLNSRITGTSLQKVFLNSCGLNSEMSSDHCSNNRSNGAIDTPNRAERVQCSSQAYTSNDFHLVVYKKRGWRARKKIGSSNTQNRYGSANILGWNGKDDNFPIWQKVHNSGAEECARVSSKPINNSSKGPETRVSMGMNQSQSAQSCKCPCSEVAIQTDAQAAISNGVDSNEFLSKPIGWKSMNDVRLKPISVSKQANHHSGKGSHTDKMNMTRPCKIQIQQKGGSESLQLVNHTKCIGKGMESLCNTNIQGLVAISANRPGFCQSEDNQKTQTCVKELKPLGNGTVHDMTSVAAQNEKPPLTRNNEDRSLLTLNYLDQPCTEENSDSSNCSDGSNCKPYDNMHVDCGHRTDTEDDGSIKSEAESSRAEHSIPSNCSRSLMQKWFPVGRKDPTAFNTGEVVSDSSNFRNVDIEIPSSDLNHSLPSTVGGLECLSPSSEDTDGQSSEAYEVSSEFRRHHHSEEEFAGMLSVSNCHSNLGVKDTCVFLAEDDLDVILRAVTNAYKFQTASESVCLVTGSPIAEFERLLHSASPVLGPIDCVKSCKACLQDQLLGDSLCLHQIPNFSLQSLWQWYERPGSYGLEVKAKDYNNSKSLRYGHFEFCAYFVPYLSAVQLFGRANKSFGDGSSDGELTEAAKGDEKFRTGHLSSLPIFSEVLPETCKQVGMNLVESSSSTKKDLCGLSIDSRLGDEELLFEYFESDQPQQRRPLYEKIKELVRGDASSTEKVFGDPLHLERLNFHNLHPASWYSVAWYPIYRIPDGNFRAAFLTYHSLGHFAHQKFLPNSLGCAACLVSPVVGLQSYNAKGECWFQPRGLKPQVAKAEEALNLDAFGILKERLRTLERTASVMARASVWKGNQRSFNRQPDYEFFLSRKQ